MEAKWLTFEERIAVFLSVVFKDAVVNVLSSFVIFIGHLLAHVVQVSPKLSKNVVDLRSHPVFLKRPNLA